MNWRCKPSRMVATNMWFAIRRIEAREGALRVLWRGSCHLQLYCNLSHEVDHLFRRMYCYTHVQSTTTVLEVWVPSGRLHSTDWALYCWCRLGNKDWLDLMSWRYIRTAFFHPALSWASLLALYIFNPSILQSCSVMSVHLIRHPEFVLWSLPTKLTRTFWPRYFGPAILSTTYCPRPFVRDILSTTFCPLHFVHYILSATFCPWHFVHWHFVHITFCPRHFVRDILSGDILSGHHGRLLTWIGK